MDVQPWMLVLIVALPFIGTGFVMLLHNRPDAREAASLASAVLTFLFCILSLPSAFAVQPVSTPALQILPGLNLQFTADALGLLFASMASLLWIITTVYNIGYMRSLREHAQTRYYSCFALTIGSVMGVALSSNLFSLFVFYEILAIAAYPLVVHIETQEALAAGRKYLFYTQAGGVAIVAGIMALLAMGNTLDFVAGGNPGIAAIAPDFARLAFFLLMAGFAVKAALVPVHGWLPSAMIAPTPVSGLLHAVAVVNTGVFGLLRLMLYLYGPGLMAGLGLQNIVIAAAVITIIVGSLLALQQDDFKLRLAYSTVSQLSYMILGAAVLVPPGISGVSDAGRAAAVIGATYAFCAHAFGKLTMFFVAGTVAVETGKKKISELDGIGRKMPWEFGAFTLATLSMVGLPPMVGFIAKYYLLAGNRCRNYQHVVDSSYPHFSNRPEPCIFPAHHHAGIFRAVRRRNTNGLHDTPRPGSRDRGRGAGPWSLDGVSREPVRTLCANCRRCYPYRGDCLGNLDTRHRDTAIPDLPYRCTTRAGP